MKLLRVNTGVPVVRSWNRKLYGKLESTNITNISSLSSLAVLELSLEADSRWPTALSLNWGLGFGLVSRLHLWIHSQGVQVPLHTCGGQSVVGELILFSCVASGDQLQAVRLVRKSPKQLNHLQKTHLLGFFGFFVFCFLSFLDRSCYSSAQPGLVFELKLLLPSSSS